MKTVINKIHTLKYGDFNTFSLTDFLNLSQNQLQEALTDSRHDFHIMSVSTLNTIQEPIARTVILRQVDYKNKTLGFHSDVRSDKIKHLKKNPKVSLLFYSKRLRLQLSFNAICTIHTQNKMAKTSFDASSSYSKQCYAIQKAPKSTLTQNRILPQSDLLLNEEAQYQHFCVCLCQFYSLHLLWLNHKGNIAAQYNWDPHLFLNSSWVVA